MADVRVGRDEFAQLSAELLGRGNRIRFRAHGRSMAPLVRDGDVLTVEPARLGDLRVGDIALHRIGEGQLVAHRVVARRVADGRPAVATRGDAVRGSPDLAREGDVLGRVVARERDGRVVRMHGALPRTAGRLVVAWVRLRALAGRLARAAARRLGRRPSRA
jgi:hypothetical protein